MDKTSPARSFGLGYQLIHDLVLMRQGVGLPERLRQMSEAFRVSFVGEAYPPLASNLAYTCFRSPELTIINVHGIIGSGQAAALNRGFATDPQSDLRWVANSMIQGNAEVITAQSLASGARGDRPVIAAGHSAGGACAQAIAGFWPNPPGTGQNRYISFGAPRMGGRRFYRIISHTDGAYYLNRYDPVPLVPFHAGEGDISRTLATAEVVYAWDQYRQPGFGVQLRAGDPPVAANEQTVDTGSAELSLLSFLLSNDAEATYYHSPELYDFRLFTAASAANDIGNTEPRILPPVPDRNRVIEPAIIQPIEDAVVIANAERAFTIAVGDPPTSVPYVASKVNGIWRVSSGELLLCICTGKTQAKRISRRMNSALGAWNDSLFGDQRAFRQAAGENFKGEA